jgi:hypothetical protein
VITQKLSKRVLFYICTLRGIELSTNLQDPILAWQEPFESYFDSTMIWGPVTGSGLGSFYERGDCLSHMIP